MPSEAETPPRGASWWTLGAVCVAVFMLLLDITVVNVALPDIQRSLDASFSDLQWVVDAYSLTLAALLLTAGSLADRLGRRRIFTTGLVLFTLASVGCGLAGSPLVLNLARGVQGIGGAAMFATSLALIASTYHGRARGIALSVWGATIGVAVAIGPLIGGLLTESLGWEWIFFVNVPIGIGAVIVTVRRVGESRDPNARGIDWAGLVTFSGALFLLVFALVRGNAEGWGSPLIVGFLAGAAALLVAFVLVERRQERPMLDLGLFRVPSFVGASAVAITLGAAMFSMFLYLTLYLQNVLGLSPLEAGVRFLPMTVASFFAALASGRLAESISRRWLLGGGMLLVTAGLLLMGGLTAQSTWTGLLAGFIVAGAGIGLTNPALASAAIGVVAPARSGMASGINNTFRQVGIATGVAALGALFEARLADRTVAALGSAARGLGGAADGAGLANGDLSSLAGAGGRAALQAAYRVGFVDALNELFLVGAAVALAGALAGGLLVRSRDFAAARAAAAATPGPPAAPARGAPGAAEPQPAPADA